MLRPQSVGIAILTALSTLGAFIALGVGLFPVVRTRTFNATDAEGVAQTVAVFFGFDGAHLALSAGLAALLGVTIAAGLYAAVAAGLRDALAAGLREPDTYATALNGRAARERERTP